jgi:hypothetical protein
MDTVIEAASKLEPLSLAILFIGLISLGLLALTTLVIKLVFQGKKK